MKPIRKILLFFTLVLAAVGVSGCEKEIKEGDTCIFCLNKEGMKIVPRPYELTADAKDTKAVIDELLLQLAADSDDVEYKKPIPDDVSVQNYVLEEKLLTLYFSNEYSSMDKVEEVLARTAIVRTMMQVDGVDFLTFYVGDSPLSDRNGNPVGVMTGESFVENPGEQINSIESAALTLYFADKKGSSLHTETREVHYSSNISMEKLVIEHLLEGPQSQDLQSAIPEGTKLLNVSVADGVCYVSFDENFLKQNYNIDEPVVIYSIVNSLSELASINKVQISVKGDTSGVYRDSFPFNKLYERNLDYISE